MEENIFAREPSVSLHVEVYPFFERFRNDTRVRAFAPWLEKRAEYYAASSFGQRFLADRGERWLPPSASRSTYERIMHYTLKYSEDEIETFREAWREMLKTQF